MSFDVTFQPSPERPTAGGGIIRRHQGSRGGSSTPGFAFDRAYDDWSTE
jgi:hypothetical protein